MNHDSNNKNGNKKKIKKAKRVLLLKNPFSYAESSTTSKKKELKAQHKYFFSSSQPGSPSAAGLLNKSPFSNNRVLLNGSLEGFRGIGSGGEEDNDDEEEDEERTIQARRDALVALDPYSNESINAEFKSLKVPAQQPVPETTVEEDAMTDQILNLYARNKNAQDSAISEMCTPRSSFDDRNIGDRNNISSTPRMAAINGGHVPDIAISLATPSPPSKPTHHRRGSSIARNAGLLSATFMPSPLSLTSEEPSLGDDFESDGISPLDIIKGPSKRSSAVYKPFFSRITGSSGIILAVESITNVGQGQGNEEIEDHIGFEINKGGGPESRRNTFGTPQPRFTVQQGQFTPQQQEQREMDAPVSRPLAPKRASTKSQNRKQDGGRGNLDPWDSCDDMLIQATDDEDDHFFGSGVSSELKGKIGGRRKSDDQAVDDSGSTSSHSSLLGGLFGRGVVDDWIVHPRTAAIRGTYNKVHDAIPVPKNCSHQVESPRPLSSSSGYTTISLTSPPTVDRGGASLSRAGSLDSSFYRLKRGATSLLMNFGPQQSDFSRGLEKKSQDLDGEDQIQRMVNGHGYRNQNNRTDQRSNSMTFGARKNVTPPLANFSSFASFQALISNQKPTSNNSPPPFSPSTYLHRAQTTVFGGGDLGTSSGSRVSFSPISNRKTPAMVPTLVIPQNLQHEQSALTATTVFTPSSGNSDTTMTMGFGNDDQYRLPRRFEEQDAYSKGMESPTLTIQSASSSATFQRLLPQRDDLLKVPEPKPAARNNSNQPTSLAASAMAAAQRARSQVLSRHGSTGSIASADFSHDDYIGQFERERAQARGDPAASMSSFGSLATTMHSSFLSAGSSSSTLNYYNGSGMTIYNNESEGFDAYAKERTASFGFGFLNGSRRERQESSQSDVTEKLMHLPEPSPFEGICSCRGIFNISSMLLILLGLVLLILGYPIASSLKKEQMEAEAAAEAFAAAAQAALRAKTNSTSTYLTKFNMDITAAKGLPGPLGASGIGRGDALVDPETPLDKRSKKAYDGTQWSLVFSDEFNQEGRSFGPGQDPHWEAIDLAPSATGFLEEYKQDAVRTKDGRLEITLNRTPIPAGKRKRQRRQGSSWMFTSGMLQSWNKMCIQGGLIEVAVSLPGNPALPGLKPRVFLLGNLARYGYRATMDGVYPYSYSKCDDSSVNDTNPSNDLRFSKQRLSACSNIQGGIGVGRGAPEISLLETHYGIQMESSAVEAQKQVLPKRRRPSSSLRKRQLQEGPTVVIEKQRLGTNRVSVGGDSVNSVASDQVQSIAISSVKVASPSTNDSSVVSSSTPQWIQPLDNAAFGSGTAESQYVKIGVEYSPGSLLQTEVQTSKETSQAAYAQFQMNDHWQDGPLLNEAEYQLVSVHGGSDRWKSAKSLEWGQIIPQEPMSMVLSLGLLQDENLLHPDLVFPAVMKIDYVRVYHPDAPGTRSMSCDPVDHPTAEYIRSHPRAYQDSALQTWAEAGYA
ncbi:hypothetical protein BGZ93_010170 [Podila epicladia]|nr:hypothetical protein BGZ92_000051 [Podila epicladia]KAG0100577.1 hypothetical protein BGZ93_010170 [Podila epicladia]